MWRGQAERRARPGDDGGQAEKGNGQYRKDCRRDYAVGKKRDDATILVGIGRVVVRAFRVRAMCRVFAMAMNPLVSLRARRQHIEQQHERDTHSRNQAG
jgi:hypothetical protein